MIPDAFIKYKRKTNICSFIFLLGNQRVFCALEVPVLVKHTKNCAAGDFRHILVEVLSERFFVDDAQGIHLVQLL